MPIVRRGEKGTKVTIEEYDGNFDALDRPSPILLTIASGIINLNGQGPGVYHVETEGGASTDNLTSIIGGVGREWEITLVLNTPGREIIVVHTLPNLRLQNGTNFLLNSVYDTLKLKGYYELDLA